VALARNQYEVEGTLAEYAELFDLAPVGYLTLDRSGMILNLNVTAAELLGRPRSHVVGRPLQVLLAPAARRRFLNDLSRLRRGTHHCASDLELARPEAPPVTCHVVSVAHPGAGSHSVEFRLALVDISERKRAEAQTAALARLGLRLSAAATPEAAAWAVVDIAQELCGWDACFVLVYDPLSDTVTDLVNMDTIQGRRVPVPAMLRGRRPSPLMRRVIQEGPQLVLRQNEHDAGPLTMRFGDTSRVSLSLMFAPVRLEDKAIGVLSVQSYRRHAYTPQDLAALQGLADHAAVALARLQAEGALRRANEQLEARVVERTAQLRQYQDHLEELVKQRTHELETANESLQNEIASRKVAEQILLRTAEELERSNLELEQFAFAASHDLQEPLRAIGGYVGLLEHRVPESLDAKAREYIQGAAQGAVRMEQQITDLLTLSRVGTRGLELARAKLDLPLHTALHNLQFALREAQATVTQDPLPVLTVDVKQMTQLFQNLIGNALKFRRKDPPKVHVGARAENGRWVVWVRDNGIGIAPQYFERIFQVFQRLHTRTAYPGTGVGLAICRRIVARHNGQIWVESQPGQGSTFYFSLPTGGGIEEATA